MPGLWGRPCQPLLVSWRFCPELLARESRARGQATLLFVTRKQALVHVPQVVRNRKQMGSFQKRKLYWEHPSGALPVPEIPGIHVLIPFCPMRSLEYRWFSVILSNTVEGAVELTGPAQTPPRVQSDSCLVPDLTYGFIYQLCVDATTCVAPSHTPFPSPVYNYTLSSPPRQLGP